MASPMMCHDIFDTPRTRSLKVIGTSTIVAPKPVGPVRQLELEPVAGGLGGARLDRREDVGPVGPEPGGGVAHAEPEHRRRVDVGRPGQDLAHERPVGGGAALHVARPDGDVGTLIDLGEQGRQAVGRMRQVGVHLHDDLVAVGEGVLEPGPVGAPEPALAGTGQHLDPAQLVGGGAGEVGGAVGLASSTTRMSACGAAEPHLSEHVGDVLGLEVRRDDDERFHADPQTSLLHANGTRRIAAVSRGLTMRGRPLVFVVMAVPASPFVPPSLLSSPSCLQPTSRTVRRARRSARPGARSTPSCRRSCRRRQNCSSRTWFGSSEPGSIDVFGSNQLSYIVDRITTSAARTSSARPESSALATPGSISMKRVPGSRSGSR